MSAWVTYTDEELTEAVKSSTSLRQVINQLGLSPKGGETKKRLARRIAELGLDTDHFQFLFAKSPPRTFLPPVGRVNDRKERLLSSILVKNSPLDNLRKHRVTLVAMGILTDYCVGCKSRTISSFGEEKPIPLQIDHVNGDSRDNRPENLRHLCPTCHSLQPTEAGKKSKGRKRRTRDESRAIAPGAVEQENNCPQESKGSLGCTVGERPVACAS
ncbi:MAG: hypothetical protein E6R04_02540 [Spirochaetes bacterium]|nr:MAG: hypothetical protein E6R04_02540 [Spirochaetota bacterium]